MREGSQSDWLAADTSQWWLWQNLESVEHELATDSNLKLWIEYQEITHERAEL